MAPIASKDVLIQTEHLEAATVFYEKLGLRVFERGDTMVGLDAGAFRLFLDRGPAYGPVFELFVEDVEAAKTRLLAAGCKIEADDPSIPRCYVRDPFGLIFNIAVQR